MVKAMLASFESHDRRIFWITVSFLVVSLGLYAYFLSISVVSVVSRKSAQQQAVRLASSISILESQYVALDKSIDLTLAHSLGFVDIDVPTYLSKNGDGRTFSLRTQTGGQ